MSEQRIALVTGASRGIGAEIALELGRQGHLVIGTATSESGADKISDALSASGIAGEGMVLNVADSDSVAQLLSAVADKHGPVTLLINNAGIAKDNLLMRMGDDEWLDVINTNLNSIYRLSKAVCAAC